MQRRYSNGLAFQWFYTFAHAMTTSDTGGFNFGSSGINNSGSNSAYAVPENVVILGAPNLSESQRLRRAPLLGALWGLGHTASLFAAGLAVLLLAVSIPEKVSGTMEFGVGVMLIFLGVTTLTGFKTGRFVRGIFGIHRHDHVHVHEDTGIVHSHGHDHHDHRHGHKSLVVGMVHGMAGSGALMLVVLSTINSVPLGLAYIALFGAGSIASMAAMSTLIGLPFAKAKHLKLNLVLKYVAAAITLAIGAGLIYELGVVEQVFL